jgi:hypothetical protein
MIYGLTYQQVFPQIAALAKVGSVVMPDLWNLNPYLFIGLFAAFTLLLFYVLDRNNLRRADKVQD